MVEKIPWPILKRKNQKIGKNRDLAENNKLSEANQVSKNYQTVEYMIDIRFFACYGNRAKKEIKIKSLTLYSAFTSTIDFGRLATFLFY